MVQPVMNRFTCPICFHEFPREADEMGLRHVAGQCCHACGHRATTDEVEKAARSIARTILARSIDLT